MNKINSIYPIRHNFLYQDRFALWKYLYYLRKYLDGEEKIIKEFYVDFPLQDQRSLDVKFIFTDGTTEIYDVKAGKSKNHMESIKKFWNLCHHEEKCLLYFVARLKDEKFFNDKKNKRLAKELKLNKVESSKMSEIFTYTSYLPDSRDDKKPEDTICIEEQIESHINILSEKLLIQDYDEIMPAQSLMRDMQYCIVNLAGREKNLHPELLEVIKCFYYRKSLGKEYKENQPKSYSDEEKVNIKDRVTMKLERKNLIERPMMASISSSNEGIVI